MEASVAAPPAQGAPPASQPPAGGQGSGQGTPTGGQGGNSDFWGRFPNVPEGQRELLQPHLQDMQGYITRMEQSNAPYKALMESVSPDQVQNLVGFLSGYSRDPLATWMGMAQSLKDDGHITNPAFSPDQLQQLIAVQEQQQAGQPGQEDLPPWAQQMQAKLNQYEQQEQQRQAAQAEAQNAQMLEQAHAGMRQTLVAAGIPDDSITPEMMNAYIIAHNGDVATATTAITNFREATLRDFASNGTGPKPPTINGSTPEAPAGALRSKKGDGFRDASLGAAQMLAQGAAQG